MGTKIVFTGKGEVAVVPFEPKEVGPGEVRVRAVRSLISTGTEGICLNRLFEPGTHWDRWVSRYPFDSGYCMVGVVDQVGAEADPSLMGRRVVTRVSHASHTVFPAAQVYRYPDGVSPDDASWFALSMIGFMGAKAGKFSLGDSVLVVGAGPIGQMVVRWAYASGVEKIGVLDPIPMRLDLARRGGANIILEGKAENAAGRVKEAFGGELPGTVVDTTGHASVFEQCLALPRWLGKLVLLGDTGTPSQQRLTLDVVTRGISIHGAHIMHEEGPWTEKRCYELFFNLLHDGRFNVDGLILHRFKPEQAREAYALTTERRDETMGVIFEWD